MSSSCFEWSLSDSLLTCDWDGCFCRIVRILVSSAEGEPQDFVQVRDQSLLHDLDVPSYSKAADCGEGPSFVQR